MRCQYVSNLLLQCKNSLSPSAPAPANSAQSSADSNNVFCEKHQSFIDNVKVHANVLRTSLDPGFRPPTHLSESEPISLSSSRLVPSHIFEPCCSDSVAFSEENPLRNARYMTDKEIVQQYSAALGRMINKVNDMRFIIHSRYEEHLKKKPAVSEERKKYKLVVRNPEEKALLERLRLDMVYSRYNRAAATYLQKSYRKYKAEQMELRGHENIRTWLETPQVRAGDLRCEHEEPIDPSSSPPAYVSSPIKNENDSDECIRTIISSVLNVVEEQEAFDAGKTRCNGRRIPMTDFCIKHLKPEPDVQLLSRCKECQAPCLILDDKLCNLHAKKLFVPSPIPLQSPAIPSQTIQRFQSVKDPRLSRLAPMNSSAWSVRQLPHHQLVMREAGGFNNMSTIRKPEVKYDFSSLSGPLIVKSRRPRDTTQRILQGERRTNEAMLTEQSRLKLDGSNNIQVWKIDDDLPINELQQQCEQRAVMDSTPSAPLQAQPKTKRSLLRVNGSNGNGVVIRGPIAIIQNAGVGSFNSNIPLVANRNGKSIVVQNGFGCARVRAYNRNEHKIRY